MSSNLNSRKVTFAQVFSRIAGLAFPMALSYTFSLIVVSIGVLSGYLNDSEEYVAATTLIMIMTNTLVIIALSPLFAMSIIASHQVGNLRDAKRLGKKLSELEEKRLKISAVNRNGLLISSFIGPILFLLMFFSKNLLVYIFGQSIELAEIAQSFLRV